ncbi:Katanin p80 WD40 repeat-containing subunit B1 homolog KTN80.2 [Linum perenne]
MCPIGLELVEVADIHGSITCCFCQVIRHFWERNDIKGAINALRRLPNHSVQADVISVLIDKIEIITLDLCSSLFPVLVGLLTSKMERHANVSLEMLLKLVAVFGPTIRSTVSAPRPVGVNLHAEERIECCNQCFVELQKIQQILPSLVRKGGVLAKSARELNLVLQRP